VLLYRFFLALLLVSLIPVSANIYQLWQAQSTTKQAVDQALISSAELIVADVNHWVELNLRSSALIAKTRQIQSMDPEQQVPILQATDATFDWSYTVFTTDLKGNSVARSDGQPLKFYGDREYVKAILDGEKVGQQVLISRTNGKPALCLSIPVLRDQRLTGTLVQCSKLINISENVANVSIGSTGFARLVDNKMRLIAHGDSDETTEELKDLKDDPVTALGITEQPVVATVNGKKIVTYSLTTDLGWRLTIMQDYDDAYAVIETSKQRAFIAGGVLALSILLLSFLLSNNISRPINKLSAIAETYSKGQLDMDIPETNRRDEIGNLAKAIERLGSGMKVMVKHYGGTRR
jgi:methyl-accepting chemotaxis protein